MPETSQCRQGLTDHLLIIFTLLGVVIGFLLGVFIREVKPSADVIMWIGIPGEVYMNMLKMTILPLIICSVITGTAALDPRCNGKIGMVSLCHILVSNCAACVFPIILTLTMRPGHIVDIAEQTDNENRNLMETTDVFADLIRNLFPANVFSACFQQVQTNYKISEIQEIVNTTEMNGTMLLKNTTIIVKVREVGTTPSTNALGLVICSMVFGIAAATVGEKSKAFCDFFQSANDVIIKVLGWFIWMTPVGVTSLIALTCLKANDLGLAIQSLGVFVLIVTGCLLFHQLLLVPLITFLLVRQNPYSFLSLLGRPAMVSFAAGVAVIAIPDLLESLRRVVDPRVSRFVIPFATMVNRDGTCIFISISVVFISQLVGEDLTAGQILLLWILTSIISMATPTVPSSSLVTIVLVLTSLGVASDYVGLLFATEWILDRFRTVSNTLNHAHCALVTHHFCKKDLDTAKYNINSPSDEEPSGKDLTLLCKGSGSRDDGLTKEEDYIHEIN